MFRKFYSTLTREQQGEVKTMKEFDQTSLKLSRR